jgi:hypothetical protein
MITNMLFNSLGKIDTGYIIIDFLYIIILTSILFYVLQPNLKNTLFRKCEGIWLKFDKTYKLKFSTNDKESSKRYRAIMHYISKSNDPTVKTLSEIVDIKFNRRYDDYEETNNSNYRVDQGLSFIVDKKADIKGQVYNIEKEEYHDSKVNN